MQQRVDQLLEMMSMSHVKDSIVGDGMHKGISGGQLKRLSIAVEIVSLPRLIFLGVNAVLRFDFCPIVF